MGWRAALLLPLAGAICPDYETLPYCSGHGDCSVSGRCDCWEGWTGGSCAERTCPMGRAWADVATARYRARLAECSNRGYVTARRGGVSAAWFRRIGLSAHGLPGDLR